MDVNLVNVPFSAQEAPGRCETSLSAGGMEDGNPQKISFFSSASDSLLSIAVVVGISGSQREFLNERRHDMRDFLRTAMTKRDQAMLVCFFASICVASPLHEPTEHLDEALKEFQKSKNNSMLPRLVRGRSAAGA